MKRFIFLVLLALAAMAPAMLFKLNGWDAPPLVNTAIFGIAVLAAGFMLSWGAEAAESYISQGLILAVVALITVLPEYAIDMYYAFQAGRAPASNYVHYAAANMTGANRLLVGLAWPLILLLHWWRTRNRAIPLAPANIIEILFLFIASLYAFVIVLKNRIDLLDTVVLVSIFGAYLWQVGRVPKADSTEDTDDEPGPAAALTKLKPAAEWTWIAGLAVTACTAILVSAEPFAEAIVASGRVLGIDEFLLIQWLSLLASEAPAISVAILFVLSGRTGGGRPHRDDQRQDKSVDAAGRHAAARNELWRVQHHGLATGRAPARGILFNRRAITLCALIADSSALCAMGRVGVDGFICCSGHDCICLSQ